MTNTHDEQKPISEGMLQAIEDARTGRGDSMKEPITDEWLWTDWTGGECPIPDAKAGEYQIQFADGVIGGAGWSAKMRSWKRFENAPQISIIAYAVRNPNYGARSISGVGIPCYLQDDFEERVEAELRSTAPVDHMAMLRQCGEALVFYAGANAWRDGLNSAGLQCFFTTEQLENDQGYRARAALEAMRKAGVE